MSESTGQFVPVSCVFSVGYTVRQLAELIVERKTWAFEKFFPVETSPYWH